MLKVSLDEGYAFDILSIYYVKALYADTPERRLISMKALKTMRAELEMQIGTEKLESILDSFYFKDLIDANKDTFNLVEEVRKSEEGLAKKLDTSNLRRYYCKVRLQEHFFESSPVEVKTNI